MDSIMDICIANLSLFHMECKDDKVVTAFIRISFRQCIHEHPLVTVITLQVMALLMSRGYKSLKG